MLGNERSLCGPTENAGVENAGVDRRGGRCRSRLTVWKAEPRLYSETALSYFLKIVLRLLTEFLLHYKIAAAFILYSGRLLDAARVM